MERREFLENKKIKHISELTAEELLEQLEKSEETEIGELQQVQVIQTPILDFIHKYNLKPGKFPVPSKALVMLYRKSTNDSNLPEKHFINKMRMYFRVVDNMIYVSKTAFHYNAQLEILLNKKRKSLLTTESFMNHVFKFIEVSEIKKGPVPVPYYVLYHIYEQYCFRNKLKPMAKTNFNLVADKLWNKTTTRYGESYLVNNKGDLYKLKDYEKIKKEYEKNTTTKGYRTKKHKKTRN